MTWDEALDAFEERLRRQEAVLVGDSGAGPLGDMPLPGGDLPAELRLRALALLDRCRELEERAARRLTELQASLSALPAASVYAAPATASATTVDL